MFQPQLQEDVAEYLLKHGDILKQEILDYKTMCVAPLHDWEDALLRELTQVLAKNLNISYENIMMFLTKGFVEKVMGLGWLSLNSV